MRRYALYRVPILVRVCIIQYTYGTKSESKLDTTVMLWTFA